MRVDFPHKGADYYHFNANTKLSPDNDYVKEFDHKSISQTTYNVAKNTGEIASGIKAGGKVLGGVGIVMDAKSINDGYKADGNHVGTNTVKATASAVGGWAGAYAGAEVGAWGGASFGTAVFPGAGTAVGGLVGGIAGAFGMSKLIN